MLRRTALYALGIAAGWLLGTSVLYADCGKSCCSSKKASCAAASEEEGFVNILPSTNLDEHWLGSTKGYDVVDDAKEGRKLICKKEGGGDLLTKKEYANFIFRFEFKLTPGANNGVAIRAPLEGQPTWTGMEIQILDDGHPKYKGWLQDYQVHGSIYGVVPAKRGFLKPVGQWNAEEICCQGRRVRVTLNGTVIVDADLDEAVKKTGGKTLDHRDHPGLKRTTGHLGFLGHGDYLEFRNLRIKELPK